jgi:rSAM/selenodomain-associated transferase 1
MIIVFARAPLPGRAKTRLVPRLGEWGAARLQARLTRHALATARAARCGGVTLQVAGSNKFRMNSQKGKDLGERMYNALSRARRPAILIGSDCPELRPADLRCAQRLLAAGYHAVLMPAEDGGYALIGLRRVSLRIFEGIAWGTDSVYRETARRLSAAGWRWRALRTVWDVDRPADLERLRWLRISSALRRAARR